MQEGSKRVLPRAVLIPKKDKSSFRLVHDFGTTNDHYEKLWALRGFIFDGSDSLHNTSVNLKKSVFGYPFGGTNMKALVLSLITKRSPVDEGDKSVLIGLDFKNFYHSIFYDCFASKHKNLITFVDNAFVFVGNDVRVLSQGSAMSQDISNIYLQGFDCIILSCLSRLEASTSDTQITINGEKISKKSSCPKAMHSQYSLTSGEYISASIKSRLFDRLRRIDNKFEYPKKLSINYIRYIDNIYIKIFYNDFKFIDDFVEILINSICKLSYRYKLVVNGKKTRIFKSELNRKEPVLGLNTTVRIKCTKAYIDKTRAMALREINNLYSGDSFEFSNVVSGRIVYILSSDVHSVSRFSKYIPDLINLCGIHPNTKILAAITRFIIKKNEQSEKVPLYILGTQPHDCLQAEPEPDHIDSKRLEVV